MFEYEQVPSQEELDAQFNELWPQNELIAANTAINEDYLLDQEKQIFFYLNLARINPQLFARTYVSGYMGDNGWKKGYKWEERKESLFNDLTKMESVPVIIPDENIYNHALCYAYEGGKLGLVGHKRWQTNCLPVTYSECIQYGGAMNGLSIVMSLLIDAGEDNASLGHRKLCLDSTIHRMGAAIHYHAKFQYNAVLNFMRY